MTMKSFKSAVEDAIKNESGEEIPEEFIEFELDGRVLKSYPPSSGQLTFLLASMGRGQNTQSRFASIVNVMLESLRGDDKDYMEGRLLSGDASNRLDVETIEAVFEYLMGEWFATPTQEQSDSAPSPSTTGTN